MGGMVLETNMSEIITRIEDQNKLEKQEVNNTIYTYRFSTAIIVYFFRLLGRFSTMNIHSCCAFNLCKK